MTYLATTRTITTETTVERVATRLHGATYQSRQAQAQAVKAAIVAGGKAEPGHPMRIVTVEGQAAFADVLAHPAGVVVHFHLHDGQQVKVRELLLLPTQESYAVWLDTGGKMFPHSGKYVAPALDLLNVILTR